MPRYRSRRSHFKGRSPGRGLFRAFVLLRNGFPCALTGCVLFRAAVEHRRTGNIRGGMPRHWRIRCRGAALPGRFSAFGFCVCG